MNDPVNKLTDAEQRIQDDNDRLTRENHALREEVARLTAGGTPAPQVKPERDPDAYSKGQARARDKYSNARASVTGGHSYVTHN